MQLPKILEGESVTRLLQGACAGALVTVLIGFNWGGWTLGSTTKQITERSVSAALVAVLAPMCVDKFRQGTDGVRNLAEFKKVSTWMQELVHSEGRLGDIPRHGLA